MARYLALLLAIVAAAFGADAADASGGKYVFDGGKPLEQRQVRAALDASSFNWNLIPAEVVVHIGDVGVSHALPGHVWLDAALLRSGRFGWATVQDEFAHQVDFFLFDTATRTELQGLLGATAWCRETAGLAHGAYGCERFASMVAWAYWPSADSSYRPETKQDETASLPAAQFRALVARLIAVRLGTTVAVETHSVMRAASAAKRTP
jgi:hypothetical protein